MHIVRDGRAGRSADKTGGYTALLRIQFARCPLARAAAALGDPLAVAALIRFHPAARCPAARQEQAP